MVDASIEIGGLRLSTPFVIGPGPYQGMGKEIKNWAKNMADNHWAGIVTKSYYGRIGFKNVHMEERPYLWTTDTLRKVGMQNRGPQLDVMSKESMKDLAESVEVAHEFGLVVIGSILMSLEDTEEATELMTRSGVDAIEVNLGCPAFKGCTLKELAEDMGDISVVVGSQIGKDPEAAAKVTSTVRGATDLPVFVKLPALDIAGVAVACKKAGAAGVTLINTVPGLMGIDIETGVPISSALYGRSFISGLSGPMIKPIGLSVVIDVATAVDISIFGVGGIAKWQDAVEYIMAGASAVQVCTAFMWKGFRLAKTMYEGLTDFMERQGYKGIADFKGASLDYLDLNVPHQEIKVVASIDPEVCNLCGLCYVACNEGSYGGVIEKDGLFVVDPKKCDGCGLCKVVCPAGAITLRRSCV